jgi:hypothetical protein
VRTIIRHDVEGKKGTFEERINLYRAVSAEESLEQAKRESQKYLEMNEGFVQIKRLATFDLGHADADLNGREVWSHLSQGPADPEQFYHEKYSRFDLEEDEGP